ncbi:site-specific integrase [Nonomuraea sp. LPB2021202275-12-8]|uniref:site-specific integrase n=1 Tax=Nonomuraea sp. LPB2021202275-12-8 TaxID=3120159 RepID=UPI00300C25DB
MDSVIVKQLGRAHPLVAHLNDFLTDLANAGASPHTRRAYRGDLIAFAAHHGEEIGALTAAGSTPSRCPRRCPAPPRRPTSPRSWP